MATINIYGEHRRDERARTRKAMESSVPERLRERQRIGLERIREFKRSTP